MHTEEIPRYQWVPFLDDFSRRHQGELVTVEVFGPDVGAQREAQALPLVGVAVDLKDNEREQVEVAVGDSPELHIMHAIPLPSVMHLARDDAGLEQALEIASEDGTRTLLRFASLA